MIRKFHLCLYRFVRWAIASFVQDSNFVLGNAQATGWPIVYCSDGFCELTGFARAHVMARGSGCRFLYGAETVDTEISKISEALEEKRELKTEIQLYRKNGTLFWCLLDIVPIKNEKGDVVLFLVSNKDITKDKNKADHEKHPSGDGDNASKSSDDSSSDDDGGLEENREGLPENYNYGRRRSRAVLYHISGQLNKQNKAKTKLQQLNRLASQMPEYKVQEVKKSRFIIVHYGIFKIGWDWLILLCTFYIAILVPINAAFRKTGRFKDFMYIDAVIEVLFAIDIFLNFRTTFLNKSGQVVYEPRLIALYYIRGWFLLDLLAAIPFDLLYAFSVETATMVHLLKLARLLRLARLLHKMERYSQYSVLLLALLMCMFALLAHWLACIWYAIGRAELDEKGGSWTAGWLYELSERMDNIIVNDTNVPDMMTSYIAALYFTCSSLTSVGFGNVSANTNMEKIFSVCAMLVGAIMHAVVFGNVTTIIQRMYARRAIFHAKCKDLKDFFRIHHFPKPLKHRMNDYFRAMWSINNGIDIRQILNDFPEEMRGEIGLHLHGEILSLPIFKLAPPGCLKSVALQTDRLVCGPGEFILRKGDAINCLYYVCGGSMEVLKEEQVVAILGKGDIFGSDVDFDDPVAISGCDVRSLAYCELLCIQMKGLVDTLMIYPDFADTFTTELPNDLTYNLREGHEDVSDDESSTAAPVITLPSISEDEEEEDEEKVSNDNDIFKDFHRKPRPRAASHGQLTEEDEEEETKGTQSSPLLTQIAAGRGEQSNMTSSDWLASKGRLPNGHIAASIGLRLAKHQSKLKQWINKARKSREDALLSSTTPTNVTAPVTTPPLLTPPSSISQRPKSMPPSAASLSNRRTPVGVSSRLAHRRGRGEKLRTCRTLPTLNSVSTERSIEQVMVHTLQMELEGTRDTVIGLERRLDDLHEDLTSISRNVDSLLRLVSQSPNPMYLSSHSLQPSYCNHSPLHHPSDLYGQPSFYFSQSTVGDARELSSGQSGSPAPECWPGSHRTEQFLSPFQATSRNIASPSPLASPRVVLNPNPGATSNTSTPLNNNIKQPPYVIPKGVHNTANNTADVNSSRPPDMFTPMHQDICKKQTTPDCDISTCIKSVDSGRESNTSDVNEFRSGESPRTITPQAFTASTTSTSTTIIAPDLHDDLSDCDRGACNSTSTSSSHSPSARVTPSPPPPILRGKSPPRPCNLSPLHPFRDRHFSFSNSSNKSNTSNRSSSNMDNYNNNPSSRRISRSHSENIESNSLHVPKASASSSMSSVNSATLHAPFAHDYYRLTQLEPCDAAFGHCTKAASLSKERLGSETSPTSSIHSNNNISALPCPSNSSPLLDSLETNFEEDPPLSNKYAESLKRSSGSVDLNCALQECIPLVDSQPLQAPSAIPDVRNQHTFQRGIGQSGGISLLSGLSGYCDRQHRGRSDRMSPSGLNTDPCVGKPSSFLLNNNQTSNRLSSPSLLRLSARNLALTDEAMVQRSQSTSSLQVKRPETYSDQSELYNKHSPRVVAPLSHVESLSDESIAEESNCTRV